MMDDNLGLQGIIPTEIGNMGSLKSLSVSECTLTGHIPSELGKLTRMENLWLYNNILTGSICKELGYLKNLKNFQTEGNSDMTGTMPSVQIRSMES